MYVLGPGLRWRSGSEWMRGLGLGFTNPMEIRGVLDVCLGCGGVGGEWVGGFYQDVEGWGGVMYV